VSAPSPSSPEATPRPKTWAYAIVRFDGKLVSYPGKTYWSGESDLLKGKHSKDIQKALAHNDAEMVMLGELGPLIKQQISSKLVENEKDRIQAKNEDKDSMDVQKTQNKDDSETTRHVLRITLVTSAGPCNQCQEAIKLFVEEDLPNHIETSPALESFRWGNRERLEQSLEQETLSYVTEFAYLHPPSEGNRPREGTTTGYGFPGDERTPEGHFYHKLEGKVWPRKS
jgi:hypothetical protein